MTHLYVHIMKDLTKYAYFVLFRFYTYGDIPLETHLKEINSQVLKHFPGVSWSGDVGIPFEERWMQPVSSPEGSGSFYSRVQMYVHIDSLLSSRIFSHTVGCFKWSCQCVTSYHGIIYVISSIFRYKYAYRICFNFTRLTVFRHVWKYHP